VPGSFVDFAAAEEADAADDDPDPSAEAGQENPVTDVVTRTVNRSATVGVPLRDRSRLASPRRAQRRAGSFLSGG
jgi:hypothetical protein